MADERSKRGKKTQFTAERQPEGRGKRPPDAVVFLRKVTGKTDVKPDMSKKQLFDTVRFMFEQCTLADLRKIKKSTVAPVYVVNIASAILAEVRKGRLIALHTFWDRFFGKLPDGDGDDPLAGTTVNVFFGQRPANLPAAILSEDDLLNWDRTFDAAKYLETVQDNEGVYHAQQQPAHTAND